MTADIGGRGKKKGKRAVPPPEKNQQRFLTGQSNTRRGGDDAKRTGRGGGPSSYRNQARKIEKKRGLKGSPIRPLHLKKNQNP